jgi:hypothetical protein
MVWVQAFPQPTTNVSNVGQTQDNWLFLQNTINTDHFFNTLDFHNGHHRRVELSNDAGALTAGMNGVLYTNPQGLAGTSQPFWRNTTNVKQIPTILTGDRAVVSGVDQPLFTLVGQPFISGILTVFLQGSAFITASAFITWEANLSAVTLKQLGAVIFDLNTDGAGIIRINTTANGTYRWNLFTIPN